jgi:ATP-dependent Lhr-like helicase
MEVSWPGKYGEIHTKILERMKRVLEEDTVYPYLKDNARARLDVVRHVARNTGMHEHSLIHLGGYSWCLFPWLGTRAFRTLRRLLKKHAKQLGISGIEFEGCYYITFKMEKSGDFALIGELCRIAERGIDPESLVEASELPVFEKYDDYVPGELLRQAYATDRLTVPPVVQRLHEILAEY